MTDTPKTMQLSPAHWRQLCLLNVAQLHDYVSSIPAHTEGGTSALTAAEMIVIDAHLAEQRAFLAAWSKSRMPAFVAPTPPAEAKAVQANGAEPVKRKGGWPKGRKRKPAQPEQAQ